MLKRLFILLSLFTPSICFSQCQTACSVTFGDNCDAESVASAGFVRGTKFSVASTTSVNTLWLYSFATDTADISLYTDNANSPNTCISGTTQNNVAVVTGWNKISINSTSLTAGNYWICAEIQNGHSGFSGSSSDNYALFSNSFTGSIPCNLTGATIITNQFVFAAFADFCSVPTPTNTPTSTPTNTPTPVSPTGGTGMMLMGVQSSNPFVNQSFSLAPGMILAGIDSLTNRPDQYPAYFRTKLQADNGNGGRGYLIFDQEISAQEGDVETFSAGGNDILNTYGYNTWPGKYSLSGEGVYYPSGSNDYLYYTVANQPTSANSKFIYQQFPSGGTFVVGYSATSGGTQYLPVTVNTAGTTAIMSVSLAVNPSDPYLVVNQINGSVCVYGFTETNNTGSSISRVAHGGIALWQFCQLDPNAIKQTLQILNPANYFICGGMNDRTTILASDYKTNMIQFTNEILSGAPSCKILLINPNQSCDYASTQLPFYKTVLQNLASSNGWGYFDWSACLGTYSNANSNGWMLDCLHPNLAGTDVILPLLEAYVGLS